QHDAARRGQAIEAGLVLLVDHRRDHVGGETRSALGHHPDQFERAQATDEGQRDHRGSGWPSEGGMMFWKTFRRLAPSTAAASEYLAGMKMTVASPTPFHTSTRGMEKIARLGLVSQPMSLPSIWLISPRSGFIKTVKVSPTPTALTRTGKKMTERRYPRAMIFDISSRASAMPMTTLSPEVTTA